MTVPAFDGELAVLCHLAAFLLNLNALKRMLFSRIFSDTQLNGFMQLQKSKKEKHLEHLHASLGGEEICGKLFNRFIVVGDRSTASFSDAHFLAHSKLMSFFLKVEKSC